MRAINEAQIYLLEKLNKNEIPQLNNFFEFLEESELLAQKQELASYINELSKEGYIRLGKGAYHTGGENHPIYKNNVRIISLDKIILMPAGKEAIQNGLFDTHDEMEFSKKKRLEKYKYVTYSVFSLSDQTIKDGPIKSNFIFEDEDLVILNAEKKLSKGLLDMAEGKEPRFEILWKWGTESIVIVLEFS